MKNSSELNIASTSDIHLGHPRNNATHIAQSVKMAFPDNHETSKLDILAIAGDFYDGLLNLPDDSVEESDLVVLYILKLCAKHNIVLIILEGTRSHDRGQPKRFLFLNKTYNINAKVYYFDKVCVHHFDEFNIDVLFVPDNANPTVERTLQQVNEKIAERGITQVDYAFVHGTFKHQVPDFMNIEKHDTDAYLRLVKFLIFAGHVHQYSRYGNFITHGSLDRIAHGEEEPKGHIRARIRSPSDMDIVFVENKNARIFKTVDCSFLDTSAAINTITKALMQIPDQSFVRIIAEPGNAILSSQLALEKRWPVFQWTVQPTKTKEKPFTQSDLNLQLQQEVIHIDRDNVVQLVSERMRTNMVDETIATHALTLLNRLR